MRNYPGKFRKFGCIGGIWFVLLFDCPVKVVFLEFIEKLKLKDGFLVMPRKWDFIGVDRETGINDFIC